MPGWECSPKTLSFSTRTAASTKHALPESVESHPHPFTLFTLSFEGSREGLGSPSSFPTDPQQLLFYKYQPPITSLESTLLQVFILENLKPFEINTYKKQGEGWSLWLIKCSKKVSDGKVCWNLSLPFSVHTSKFRIPQPLYLPLLRKHPGCGGILSILARAKMQDVDVQRLDVPKFPRAIIGGAACASAKKASWE